MNRCLTMTIFEHMQLGLVLKNLRDARGISQKEMAAACKMDQAQYSRIENGKTDPSFSIVLRIANALNIELYDLFKNNQALHEVQSADKSVMEKVALIEQLDKKEKAAFYTLLDALLTKKKLKDALTSALGK